MSHLKIRFQKTCPLITLSKALKILKFRYNETLVMIFHFWFFKNSRCLCGLKFSTVPLSIPSLIALLSALNNSVFFRLVFDVMNFDRFSGFLFHLDVDKLNKQREGDGEVKVTFGDLPDGIA